MEADGNHVVDHSGPIGLACVDESGPGSKDVDADGDDGHCSYCSDRSPRFH